MCSIWLVQDNCQSSWTFVIFGYFLLVFQVKKAMILVMWRERVYVPLGSKVLKCLTKNYRVKILSKSNVIYTIGKPSKHRYLKWSCIFNLMLWTKNYDENKSQGQFSPREQQFPMGRRKNLTPSFSFCHNF